jgi:hypothetical protein
MRVAGSRQAVGSGPCAAASSAAACCIAVQSDARHVSSTPPPQYRSGPGTAGGLVDAQNQLG